MPTALAVDLRLLRDVLLPEVRIAPGRMLAARVVAAEGGRGSLSIAGYLIDAELPAHVRAGQELRLEVRDVSSERVLLQIADPNHPAPPPVPPQVPLPGGGALTVTERDHGGARQGSQGARTVSVRYDAPALGPMDLRFELAGESLRVQVAVAPGEALERARAGAAALREALGPAASVTVAPRRDPVDVYA